MIAALNLRPEAWQFRGACSDGDFPDSIFFPDWSEGTLADKKAHRELVADLCCRCQVRVECLEFAVRTDQKYGWWGGKSEQERQRIRRNRIRLGTL